MLTHQVAVQCFRVSLLAFARWFLRLCLRYAAAQTRVQAPMPPPATTPSQNSWHQPQMSAPPHLGQQWPRTQAPPHLPEVPHDRNASSNPPRPVASFAIRPKLSKAAQLAHSKAIQRPSPAFVTVPEKNPPKTPPTPGGPGGKEPWPQSLRDWVRRAFDNCQDTSKEVLHETLKKIITDAQEKGELWSRDWANVPLPGESPPKEPVWDPYSRFGPVFTP